MFSTFCPGAGPPSHWHHPKAINFDYTNLSHWIELARKIEEAKFDCFFWADFNGVHDTYKNSTAPAIELALQFPVADPVTLTAALVSVTQNLGFVFSANVIQTHPTEFSRRVSTLDHLSNGRIGWNIVASFQKSAWQNLGYDDVEPHAVRYRRAEEYVNVLYKLVEGSWEDGAVVRDVATGIFGDPSKVHPIGHKGEFYRVPGIHGVEPSPQRVPVLFQAGSSSNGRDFSARHSEAIFFVGNGDNPLPTFANFRRDMVQRLKGFGRKPTDLQFFVGRNYVIGSTEEEARRKDRELQQFLRDTEYVTAYMSSIMGVDFSQVDMDKPFGDFQSDAIQGLFRQVAESYPDKQGTFRDVAMVLALNRFVGTPDQAADEVETFLDAGVDGINYQQMTGTHEVYGFIDHVCPVLKKRGLMQSEYAPGTFREKLFAGTESESGPLLNERHPAAQFRARKDAEARTGAALAESTG
ncbi:NtaA/DmoA family FMN-dependent monooxygenase [Sphingobium herbicidovorans]|nr:NtaA/DmoA family FMN-dependent monooxygenase [Sphingobium herbicidovorans]